MGALSVATSAISKAVSPYKPLLYLAAVAAVAWAASSVYDKIDAGGYNRCRAEWAQSVADAKGKRDAQLVVAQLKADAITKALMDSDRKIAKLGTEYISYANAITGVCDPALGVLVAAASSSASPGVPEAARPPTGTTQPDGTDGATSKADEEEYGRLVAAAVAGNVAVNYPLLTKCLSGFNAVLDWHDGVDAAMESGKE